MRLWGNITKVEEQADGTLIVGGIASSEAQDSDGEIILASAMEAAIPEYMKFGCVREMHQPIAAGTALICQVQEDGKTYLETHVVDAGSVSKVKNKVLKGFSIGGKVLKRDPANPKVITQIDLREISLVDRGANPDAVISLVKMEAPDMDPTHDTPPEQNPGQTTNPDTPPEGQPTEDTRKGQSAGDLLKAYAGEEIWDARMAISCLDDLFYLLTKEMAEGEGEQVAMLKDVCDKLRAFIAAEIMEDNTNKADGTGDLAKAGAKYSKKTKEALKALKDRMAELAECMKAFDDADSDEEEEQDEEDAGKATASGDLQKALKDGADALAKVQAEKDALAGNLEKVQKELDALKAAKPLKIVSVGKDEDSSATPSAPTPVAKSATPGDPLEAMRKVHQSGGTPLQKFVTNPNRLG